MALCIKQYDSRFLIVLCDTSKYKTFFEPLGAKIHKDGFLVDREKENHLHKIISFIEMKEKGRSRKKQMKFHRECSDDEYERTKEKYKKSDPKAYYKTFNSRPVDFKKINKVKEDDDSDDYDSETSEYSSSTHNSSSTDNYPSPATPRKTYSRDDIEDIYKQLGELKKRILILEMNQKK